MGLFPLPTYSQGIDYHIGYIPARFGKDRDAVFRRAYNDMFCTSTLRKALFAETNLFIRTTNIRREMEPVDFRKPD
jgi:hypothetical protein